MPTTVLPRNIIQTPTRTRAQKSVLSKSKTPTTCSVMIKKELLTINTERQMVSPVSTLSAVEVRLRSAPAVLVDSKTLAASLTQEMLVPSLRVSLAPLVVEVDPGLSVGPASAVQGLRAKHEEKISRPPSTSPLKKPARAPSARSSSTPSNHAAPVPAPVSNLAPRRAPVLPATAQARARLSSRAASRWLPLVHLAEVQAQQLHQATIATLVTASAEYVDARKFKSIFQQVSMMASASVRMASVMFHSLALAHPALCMFA